MERRNNIKIYLLLVNIWVYWPHVFAQEELDFVSLACGRRQSSGYTDSITGLYWTPDDPYISTGNKSYISPSEPSVGTLRFFPSGIKNCYTLSVTKKDRYLLRGTFTYANYDSLNNPPQFSVAIDATTVFTVTLNLHDQQAKEVIVTAQSDYLSYCLLPIRGSPLISLLELRRLNTSSYTFAETNALTLLSRIDSGNTVKDVRFPTDSYDRIWRMEGTGLNFDVVTQNITQSGSNEVPELVLQTARVADNFTRRLDYIQDSNPPYDFLVFLHFAELESNTNLGDRVFNVIINGNNRDNITSLQMSPLYGRLERPAYRTIADNQTLTVTLEALPDSKDPPSLNGIEIYQITPMVNTTKDSDVQALMGVKNEFNLVNWAGDPCLPGSQGQNFTSWEGVTCQTLDGETTVAGLDLSNQNLMGSIPGSINQLTSLLNLTLVNNNLNSSLPDLSGLTSLTNLDLRYNQLQGSLPNWIGRLPKLTSLQIDHNNFSGTIPANLAHRGPVFIFTSTDNPSLHSPSTSVDSSATKNTIIGVFVGIAAFLLSIAIAVVVLCYRRQQARVRPRLPMFTPDKSPGPLYVMKSPMQDLEYKAMKSTHPEELSLKEVQVVTEKFKNRIGEGGFGSVYFGTLPDGSAVAVKVRSLNSNQGIREFNTELELLREVRHENLLPLVGYCKEHSQQILVYPYMSNGSLYDRLHGRGPGRKPLDWLTRINIVVGAARGLHFLHTGGDRCIIHRDVKSSNILLDDSMQAKIADFGFSKYSPIDGDSLVSTEVRGTAGYLDPEYYSTQQLTEKSDVFSFGIVLLEIVCGREPLSLHRPRDEWSLLEWVRPFIKQSNIQEIVDPDISQTYTPESLWRVLETALQSVEDQASRRPTVADIVRELEDALIIENNASQYMASVQTLDSYCISSLDVSLKAPLVCALPSPFETSPFSETINSTDSR